MKKTKIAVMKDMEITPGKKELQVQDSSIDSFISQAIASNAPIETMERLFALHEKAVAAKAKSEFVRALANFQEECPVIKKTRNVLNKDGKSVRYSFAPIDSIVNQIRKPLSNNSISYRWEVRNDPGFITAVAIITHDMGHSESSDFKIPIDTEGYMTAPQKYASALTFAKRYSLLNALGISTGDEDTDATDVNKEPEALSDRSKIVFLLKALGVDTSNKEECRAFVVEKAKLEPIDGNLGEIRSRLEVLVTEKNENA